MGTRSAWARLAAVGVAGLSLGWPAGAQWITQTVELRPGWNAVFLEVQPEPNDCDRVFAGVPVECVWAWGKRFEPVRYVQDADSLTAGQPDWLTYYPVQGGNPAATDLFAVTGGRAYLVKLAGTQSAVLRVQGQPVVPRRTWVPDSYNLVGLPVDPTAPPTVAGFFAPSTAHKNHKLHALNAAGKWETVVTPASTTLVAGQAYWAYAAAPSEYVAPVSLRLEQGSGLDFGRAVEETALVLHNDAGMARTVTLRLLASEPPSAAEAPYLAGAVPLSYYRVANGQAGWTPLDGPLLVSVAAAGETQVRLAVRRADMTPFAPPSGPTTRRGVLYASILEVADGQGVLYRVPVSSEGATVYRAREGQLRADPELTGLWVGYARVNQVSVPASLADSATPKPTASAFEFRLIVHVDAQLQARLLQQVALLFQPGRYGQDPENTAPDAPLIVTQPGQAVLITDETLLKQYSGSSLRDGQLVGRRISSAGFGLRAPLAQETDSGAFNATGTGATPVRFQTTLGANDDLNPFKHKYHPDHDNLDARFEGPAAEAFEVTRQIRLGFSATDPEAGGAANPAWGSSEVGGTYEETLHGLHKADIVVQGVFRLNKVSSVDTLNATQ